MCSSSSTPLLFLLLSLPLFPISTFVRGDYLSHNCESSDGEKSISPYPNASYKSYQTNLDRLIERLVDQVPKTGFVKTSVGTRNDAVYGLALCRGDVSSVDCKDCATEATVEVRKLCHQNRSSIIWYDFCLVKYSSTNFFGKIDEKNKFYMENYYNLTDSPNFVKKTMQFLGDLSKTAVSNSELYAAKKEQLCEFLPLYGLVQCTRDLSANDCNECLADAISSGIPSCCSGSQGGRVVGGSCSVRYEIYPFFSAPKA